MHFAKLNDQELMLSTKNALDTETRATTNVVRHFYEISRREIHLRAGFSTLFAFIENRFGLDGASIQRRVNAVELAKAVPEVLDLIDEGRIGLSSVADIQTFLNHERGKHIKYSPERKRELLNGCLDQSVRKIRETLATKNPDVRFSESKTQISTNQYRVTYVSKMTTEEKYERIREIRSHVNPYASRDEILDYIFETVLEKIDPDRRAERARKRDQRQQDGSRAKSAGLCRPKDDSEKSETESGGVSVTTEATVDESAPVVGEAALVVGEAALVVDEAALVVDEAALIVDACSLPTSEAEAQALDVSEEVLSDAGEIQLVANFREQSRYTTAKDRHEIQRESDGCCFVSDETGQRCGSRFQLQYDHIVSYSAGGSNEARNRQAMCGVHNRLKYRTSKNQNAVRAPTQRYAG